MSDDPRAEFHNLTVLSGVNKCKIQELTAAATGLDSSRKYLVAIYVPDGPLTTAATLWVQRQEVDAVLLHSETTRWEAEALAGSIGCSHFLTGRVEGRNLHFNLEPCQLEEKRREPGPTRITLLTSGTTGKPKPIAHTCLVVDGGTC